MSKATIVGTEHVSKVFGKGEAALTALENISLSIEDGGSVAIVGKSGSGKSTLMHILAMLDKPSQGNVLVEGKNAAELTDKQLDQLRNQQFGFVFQQFFLNESDTALNNVILPLKIGRVRRKERIERGIKVLKEVELEEKANSKAGTLSGGQKQRVCIARALINNPKVIFADEPTGNLDSHTGKIVEDMLFRLNKQQGITLIIVTHDEDLAARCQRRVYIKDGVVVSKGEV